MHFKTADERTCRGSQSSSISFPTTRHRQQEGRYVHMSYLHTLAHTFAYIHTHIHTHRHMHTYAHMYTYTQAHTYTHNTLNTHTHTYTHTHVHTRTHVHTCTHTQTHTHTHTYTHTHTKLIFYSHLAVQAPYAYPSHSIGQRCGPILRVANETGPIEGIRDYPSKVCVCVRCVCAVCVCGVCVRCVCVYVCTHMYHSFLTSQLGKYWATGDGLAGLIPLLASSTGRH